MVITIEELAINGLRESFHHWVRTVRIPVVKSRLADPLAHEPASKLRYAYSRMAPDWAEKARDIWSDVEHDLRAYLKKETVRLAEVLRKQLDVDRAGALAAENERFQSRQGELSALVAGNTMKKLERELRDLQAARQQGLLFDEEARFDDMERSIEQREEELKRRAERYDQLRMQLAAERKRIVNELIPMRYRMEGTAQLMPVAVEIVLPEASA